MRHLEKIVLIFILSITAFILYEAAVRNKESNLQLLWSIQYTYFLFPF